MKCCEIFFETLNVPALCIQAQSVLAMYGSGATTGFTIDFGYDTTSVTPIYEGGVIKYAIMKTNLASRQVTDYIHECLAVRKCTPMHNVIVDIRKQVYVSQNVTIPRYGYKRPYKLPIGKEIDISQEMFMAGEILFQPDLVCGKKTEYLSLQDALVTSSLKVDPELRMMMFEAIVLCGGMATIPGVNERLYTEVEKLTGKQVNVITSMEPYTVPWLGGAAFAGMPEARQIWVTKKQFEDYGAKIVKTKFG